MNNNNNIMIFCQEPEYGNLEYKLTLNNLSKKKEQRYSTQLLYRVLEGEGVAIYIIGVSDNGKVIGIKNIDIDPTINRIQSICHNVNCKIGIILNSTLKNKKFLIIKILANFDINSLPYII